MRCGYDILPSTSDTTYGAASSFNDCFQTCSTRATCAGFTYSGATNGAGAGNCYGKRLTSGTNSSFTYSGNTALVAAIKLSNYPPIPPQYTCPGAQNRTVVTDPNTQVQYVLWCNYDTIGDAPWSIQVTDSFNDCFYQCSISANSASGTCTGFTYQPSTTGDTYGVGAGTCYM